MVESAFGEDVDRLIEELFRAVEERGCTISTAESLTGGQLAAAIAAAPQAGQWFRGGIVAYHPEVKYDLLEAPRGPVVTPETAAAMARSAAELLGGEYSVALTGVGGPEPSEGHPPGTVYLASYGGAAEPTISLHRFEGRPVEVMEQTIKAALTELIARIRE